MKKLTFCLVATFILFAAQAQEFEGKIIYQLKCESKIPNIASEQFTAMMGAVQEYYYRSGDYRMQGNGTFFQWQLFVRKDNKLYSKLSSSASIYFDDVSQNKDELLKVEVKKNATTILGHPCDELIFITKNGQQRYYYSSRFAIDPEKFKTFKFNNWSEYVSRAKAVPLKMYIETPQFNFESVATDIQEIKLDNKLFQLPANSTIEKSPY
jgi:hypothetical protein